MAFVRGYFKFPGPIIGKATEAKHCCMQSCKHVLSPLPSAYKTTKVVPKVHPPSLPDSTKKYLNIQITYYFFCKTFLNQQLLRHTCMLCPLTPSHGEHSIKKSLMQARDGGASTCRMSPGARVQLTAIASNFALSSYPAFSSKHLPIFVDVS